MKLGWFIFYYNEELLEENLSKHCSQQHNTSKRKAEEVSVKNFLLSGLKKLKQDAPENEYLLSDTISTQEKSGFRPQTNIPSYDSNTVENKTYLETQDVQLLIKTVKNIDSQSLQSINELKILQDSIKFNFCFYKNINYIILKCKRC